MVTRHRRLILGRQTSVRAKSWSMQQASGWIHSTSGSVSRLPTSMFSVKVCSSDFAAIRPTTRRSSWRRKIGTVTRSFPGGPSRCGDPTETFTPNLQEGFAVTSEDIRLLVEEYDKHFAKPFGPEDVVSLRCGVRGLAVARSTPQSRSQSLSRKYVVHRDRDVPWVSIHGGKLTSCVPIADAAVATIGDCVSPSTPPSPLPECAEPEMESFPGLNEKVPSSLSCAKESCWSLQDYLRRRTNIAQWVPRGGLGFLNENAAHLESLSHAFSNGDPNSPRAAVRAYQRDIEMKYDRVLLESSLMSAPVEVL